MNMWLRLEFIWFSNDGRLVGSQTSLPNIISGIINAGLLFGIPWVMFANSTVHRHSPGHSLFHARKVGCRPLPDKPARLIVILIRETLTLSDVIIQQDLQCRIKHPGSVNGRCCNHVDHHLPLVLLLSLIQKITWSYCECKPSDLSVMWKGVALWQNKPHLRSRISPRCGNCADAVVAVKPNPKLKPCELESIVNPLEPPFCVEVKGCAVDRKRPQTLERERLQHVSEAAQAQL